MLIKVENVTYKIPNGHVVYEDMNFKVELGEFIGVLGKNGAGKTTLIDLLMGFRPVTSGFIEVLGENPMSFHRRNKQNIAVLSHDIQIQKSHSVRNYLDFNAFFYDKYDLNKELDLLDYFDINPNAKMGSLSTGQRVKAQIISAISARPKLLLMDEVTAVLDPESRKQFFVLMKEIRKQNNCSLLIATNIAEDLNGIVDNVLFIDNKHTKIHPVNEIEHLFNLKESA